MALFGSKGKKGPKVARPPCPQCGVAAKALGTGRVSRVPKNIECFVCEEKKCDAIYQYDPNKGLLWLGTYSFYIKEKWIDNPNN